MTDQLSPAAQAVVDAYEESWDGHYVDGEWVPAHGRQLAAALRAFADQVVPEVKEPRSPLEYELGLYDARDDVREQLLAIAAELEGTHD